MIHPVSVTVITMYDIDLQVRQVIVPPTYYLCYIAETKLIAKVRNFFDVIGTLKVD